MGTRRSHQNEEAHLKVPTWAPAFGSEAKPLASRAGGSPRHAGGVFRVQNFEMSFCVIYNRPGRSHEASLAIQKLALAGHPSLAGLLSSLFFL